MASLANGFDIITGFDFFTDDGRASDFDVLGMVEVNKIGDVVDFDPLDGSILFDCLVDFLDFGGFGSDDAMAIHAEVCGGDSGMFTFFGIKMAISASDFIFFDVEVMREFDGLDGLVSVVIAHIFNFKENKEEEQTGEGHGDGDTDDPIDFSFPDHIGEDEDSEDEEWDLDEREVEYFSEYEVKFSDFIDFRDGGGWVVEINFL